MKALATCFALLAGLSVGAQGFDIKKASDSISGQEMLRHIKRLSSDEFEGRGPATRGEELTIDYLVSEFKKIGLEPGNPNGAWAQEVPMVGVTSTSKMLVDGKEFVSPQDYVGWSPRAAGEHNVKASEMVFVGYGVEAPEYGWNDYKGVDVTGKTLVILVNDPPVMREGSDELDTAMFKGKSMTYYGRWTYKYEIAAAKGAAAALIIHETGPAGYPYFVVINSWTRENFMLKDSKEKTVTFQGWLSLERAKSLLASCGHDFDDLKKRAVKREFRPVPLGVKLDVSATNTTREVRSKNVIAKLAGKDASKKNENVIYVAHWDHLGKDPRLQGDQIYNGAMDNASGTAAMLEIARAFTRLQPRPPRSVLFLAVTAEEKGLLGSQFYAEHPLYPLEKTLAVFNLDGASLFGRRKDLGIVGMGNSTLDDLVADAAKAQGRTVRPELSGEKGYYYRSDHFEFAKVGVPALYLDKIDGEYVDKPSGYAKQKHDEYLDKDYHKVSDEVRADWDFGGAVEDAQVLFQAGERVTREEKWPEWKPGTEFKARRDTMLKRIQ